MKISPKFVKLSSPFVGFGPHAEGGVYEIGNIRHKMREHWVFTVSGNYGRFDGGAWGGGGGSDGGDGGGRGSNYGGCRSDGCLGGGDSSGCCCE